MTGPRCALSSGEYIEVCKNAFSGEVRKLKSRTMDPHGLLKSLGMMMGLEVEKKNI